MAVGTMTAQARPETETLQAEMKLLNWHKLANEAALKAALLKTKQLKERDAKPRTSEKLREQAAWMQRVIEEEQAKPLEVSREFVAQYQRREQQEEQRLDDEVTRHITSLKKLRGEIESRERLRARKEEYKRAKAANARRQPTETRSEDGNDRAEQKAPQGGTLRTVISSLDRLVDLERRIASLEKDSLFDRVEHAAGSVASSEPAGSRKPRRGRTGLKFTKQRIPMSTNRPSKNVYAVRLQHGARGPRGAASSSRYSDTTETTRGSKSGSKSRQDQAINNWMQRKKNRGRACSGKHGPVVAPSVGAASGCRGRNAAQQQFLDMKNQVEKRKDKMRRTHATATAKIPPTTFRRRNTKASSSTLSSSRPAVAKKKKTSNTTTATTRMPNIRGNASSSAAFRKPQAAHLSRKAATRSSAKAQTLPHVAGGGIQGVRGMRQAWP